MARELGMNPKKLGKIDNHRQEPWQAPLPVFIKDMYAKRFGRERPEVVVPDRGIRTATGTEEGSAGAAKQRSRGCHSENRCRIVPSPVRPRRRAVAGADRPAVTYRQPQPA
jgi:hypothetical protein